MILRRAIPAALLIAAALGGCASLRKPQAERPSPPAAPAAAPAPAQAAAPPRVMRLIVPKPVKCVPDDLGPPPAYPDTDASLRGAGGAADRYQLLAAGRLLRQERLQKLEEVVKRCRNAGR